MCEGGWCKVQLHTKVALVAATPVPASNDQSAAARDRVGRAEAREHGLIDNCAISGKVTDLETVDIDTDGVSVIWIVGFVN